MSNSIPWQENNDRRLADALAVVRTRLERFIQRGNGAEQLMAATVEPADVGLSGNSPHFPIEGLPDTSGGSRYVSASAASAIDVETDQESEPESTLGILARALGLSEFEQNVLLLCAGMELDTRIPTLCARAQEDARKTYPTFALAFVLFDNPSWDVLSPNRPLRYWRLLEIVQSGGEPLTASPLRADERIISYLKGLNYLDDRVTSFLSPPPLAPGYLALSSSQNRVVRTILRRWQHTPGADALPVIQLLGPDPVSKYLVAYRTAAEWNHRVYHISAEVLPSMPADLETLARLWERESRLLPIALYVDAEELESATDRPGSLTRFLGRGDGVYFVGTREAIPMRGRSALALDVAKPTAAEQRQAWNDALGEDAPESPGLLAAQFSFNLSDVQRLAQIARAETADRPVMLAGTVWEICAESERSRLDALAQRLEPKATWDDLILPEAEMKLLHDLAAQVIQRHKVYTDWGFDRKMNRGFGISALFSGESGTGKTMAAEVIAGDLQLDLYRIDLSAVVNKYIGETEKNLRRLFDAAEDGGAILFFDEADALFGKRSEVKDSHDRYANIEVNYLLQRIESYRGLAILATNMKSGLDKAFLRRIRFVVNFPFPGAVDRKRMWEKVFLQDDLKKGLSTPPLDRLDYERLSRLNLAGGQIHNVALNAAFLAANAGAKVSMPLILEAAKAEFHKLERPINEAEFRIGEPIAG